jgi:hypothetical protein
MDKREKLVAEFRREAVQCGVTNESVIDQWSQWIRICDWKPEHLRASTTLYIKEALRVQDQDDAAQLAERFIYPNDERDEWLREQRCNGATLDQLVAGLHRNESGWETLTVGGITRAIGP